MQEVWRWGADLILVIQAVHTPALDVFFNIITLLGSEEFYLLLLPLLYWCVDKRLAQRLAYLFLLSVYSNVALKSLFRHPRPFQYDSQVLKLSVEPARDLGYGLPSGHSQAAITVWGYLVVQARRRWIRALGVALMILIPFSRIYLGVHFPTDVLVGLLIGVIWLGLFLWIEPRLEPWLARQSIGVQVGLVAAVPLILLVLHSSKDAAAAMGTLIGLGMGIVIEGRAVCFSTDGALWQRTIRFFVGIVAVVALREGLKLVFPGEGETLYVLFRVIRYSAVGLWVALIGPWVFQRVGLANTRELRVSH
jgi:membrane-associated phospholipid phosphatase